MLQKKFTLGLMMMMVFAFITKAASAKEVIKLVIKENTGKCVGVAPMTCLLVKYKHSTDWEFFYDGIKGFKYEEGYRYTVLVQKTKRKHVPADASAYEYKLVKVLEKTKTAPDAGEGRLLNRLSGKTWHLTGINGRKIQAGKALLKLDGSAGRFFANAGCNNLVGGFKVDESTGIITFSNAASTLMACPDSDAMKLEGELGETLARKPMKAVVKGKTLQLVHDGKVVMTLEEK